MKCPALLLAAVLASCSPPPLYVPARPVVVSPVPPMPHELVAVARGVVTEGNSARRQAGVGGLAVNDSLTTAATRYAIELAQRGVLDHVSRTPGLETMTARIEAAGGTWVAAAENLAQLTGDAPTIPGRVIEMWRNSPGHNRNLLAPQYTHTGVGVAVDGQGRWFIVQLYVRPRG